MEFKILLKETVALDYNGSRVVCVQFYNEWT